MTPNRLLPNRSPWIGSPRRSAVPARMLPEHSRAGSALPDLVRWGSSLLIIGIAVLRLLGLH